MCVFNSTSKECGNSNCEKIGYFLAITTISQRSIEYLVVTHLDRGHLPDPGRYERYRLFVLSPREGVEAEASMLYYGDDEMALDRVEFDRVARQHHVESKQQLDEILTSHRL